MAQVIELAPKLIRIDADDGETELFTNAENTLDIGQVSSLVLSLLPGEINTGERSSGIRHFR